MSTINVVIIDDDQGIRWVLNRILEMEGISCCSAATALDGLALLERHQSRLAIVDLKLGGMNGLEVAKRLPGISPDTSIIFLSGYSAALEGQIDDLPVAAVFSKPFDVAELTQAVKAVIQ